MAKASYVEALAGGLDSTLRRALRAIFDYVLRNLRFGRYEASKPSENFQAYFYTATTDAVANTEFSIAHSLGRTPYLLIPVLPLDVVNAQIVPLKVTKAADAQRVYLSSSTTSAVIHVLIEAP